MSDLSMYELEDIIWDDFDRSDDHIVPHASNDRGTGNSCEGDSCKKPRREVTPALSNAGNLHASDSVSQAKEERDSSIVSKKRNMLEKDPWSHTPDGVFDAASDGVTVKDMPGLASDDTRMSSHCFKSSNVTSISRGFCSEDHILNNTAVAGDNNSYDYTLSQIPQTDDLSFLDNDCEDKESSDLLYYGWPDIGNFEDVDRMLRTCDSSFGLGVTGSEEELGWFTSDDPIGGPEEALKLDFKFPCSEPSALKNISEDHGPPDLDKRSNYISESKDESKNQDQGVESNGVIQLKTERSNNFKKDNKMVNMQKKQSKHQSEPERKKIGQLGNGGSFYHSHDVKDNDIQHSSIDASDQAFTSIGHQQQKRNLEIDSFGYMQNNTSYVHPDYGHTPGQTTAAPILSGTKSENKCLTTTSQRESSYASNSVQSIKTSGDPSFRRTAVKGDEQKKVHHSHGFHPSCTGNRTQLGMVTQASKSDLVSAPKQVHHMSGNELESQSDPEGIDTRASTEIGSLNVPESSSISSGLDEISLEATSFRQLQQVMEQLDLRTKLCIRDSLYRLARSAEQRHNYANLSGSAADYRDVGGPMMAEGTNKCTEFMDMETDTNPIDRSIAHLLFHRPSESPNLPTPLPLKPNPVLHGSITSPPMMAGKLVSQEEAAAESDDKILPLTERNQ